MEKKIEPSSHDKILPGEYIQIVINSLDLSYQSLENVIRMLKTTPLEELRDKMIQLFGQEEWDRMCGSDLALENELNIKLLLQDKLSAIQQMADDYKTVIAYLSPPSIDSNKKTEIE